LEETIKEKLPAQEVIAQDESDGCGAKFNIIVVSKAFESKPPLERHRMVHDCIKDLMKSIHALSLKTWTPEQWEKKKNETN